MHDDRYTDPEGAVRFTVRVMDWDAYVHATRARPSLGDAGRYRLDGVWAVCGDNAGHGRVADWLDG
jgi:hypothetical protein